ncbi:10110_t:CDS:1 [Acaulospora morrowiae]|uniref:10110_t:CDS:1 n=1 Tax=Acaulospora morrowiae TaxID=94023 RepID=A0A9N9B9R5_9GLOM|nr:10110_t:CDS:1 [Acaulospora morrowiae]
MSGVLGSSYPNFRLSKSLVYSTAQPFMDEEKENDYGDISQLLIGEDNTQYNKYVSLLERNELDGILDQLPQDDQNSSTTELNEILTKQDTQSTIVEDCLDKQSDFGHDGLFDPQDNNQSSLIDSVTAVTMYLDELPRNLQPEFIQRDAVFRPFYFKYMNSSEEQIAHAIETKLNIDSLSLPYSESSLSNELDDTPLINTENQENAFLNASPSPIACNNPHPSNHTVDPVDATFNDYFLISDESLMGEQELMEKCLWPKRINADAQQTESTLENSQHQQNEEAMNKEATNEEVINEEVTNEKDMNEEGMNEEFANEKVMNEEGMNEEFMNEVTNEEVTNEEVTNEKITNEEATNEKVTNEEIMNEEVTNNQVTNNESTNDEPTNGESTNDEFVNGDAKEDIKVKSEPTTPTFENYDDDLCGSSDAILFSPFHSQKSLPVYLQKPSLLDSPSTFSKNQRVRKSYQARFDDVPTLIFEHEKSNYTSINVNDASVARFQAQSSITPTDSNAKSPSHFNEPQSQSSIPATDASKGPLTQQAPQSTTVSSRDTVDTKEEPVVAAATGTTPDPIVTNVSGDTPGERSLFTNSRNSSVEPSWRHIVKKARSKWTSAELEALEEGMNLFGTSWVQILEKYGRAGGPLRNRNPVQLKDKARNEKLRRIKMEVPLGIFEKATGGYDNE